MLLAQAQREPGEGFIFQFQLCLTGCFPGCDTWQLYCGLRESVSGTIWNGKRATIAPKARHRSYNRQPALPAYPACPRWCENRHPAVLPTGAQIPGPTPAACTKPPAADTPQKVLVSVGSPKPQRKAASPPLVSSAISLWLVRLKRQSVAPR